MSLMSIVVLILVLAGIGVLLHLVMKLPMSPEFKQYLPIIVLIAIVVFLIAWFTGYVTLRGR